MSGYALITLNMIEYADVYLKKQSAEYARIILNVSDAVHSIRSLNLLSSYWDKRIHNTVKHLDKAFCKKNNAWMQMHKQKFFRVGGGVCETRALRWTFHQKHNQGLSFQNQETFLSLVGRLCVWLNMHQYPWIYLNLDENGWINCSD